MYIRLINKRIRVAEEDKKIKEKLIKKFCEVNSNDDIDRIMKGVEPLLRNTRRAIFLMGENYEEVNKENKSTIATFMTSTPNIS